MDTAQTPAVRARLGGEAGFAPCRGVPGAGVGVEGAHSGGGSSVNTGWAGAQGACRVSPTLMSPHRSQGDRGWGQVAGQTFFTCLVCSPTSASVWQPPPPELGDAARAILSTVSHTHAQHFRPAPTCRDPPQSLLAHRRRQIPGPHQAPTTPMRLRSRDKSRAEKQRQLGIELC